MLLTAPLLSKSSFFGSLLNKVRQVKKVLPTAASPHDNSTDNSDNSTNNVNHFTSSPPCVPRNNVTAVSNATSAKPNKLPPTNRNANSVAATATATATATANDANQLDRPAVLNPSAGLKTLEEKIGLPPRPKKPLTPYFRYMREMRPKVVAQNPKVNHLEVVRILSKEWETVGADMKARLQEEYKRDQQQYVEVRAKYDAKITDEQRAEMKQLKQDLVEAKERKLMRKRVKELGRPKKPASAFLRFIIAERVNTPQLPKQTYREWHKKCTEKWLRLSDDEKAPYLKEARVDLDKYKKEIVVWEEKMIRLGNIDVVRPGNLIDPPEPKPKKQLEKH